ncbi:MAG: type II secretion system protein J [Thiolinea sp.]
MKLSGKPHRHPLTQGFTLVELLVALFVFSLISAFAYRAINNLISAGSTVEVEMTALANVQRAMQMLERDLRQKAVPVVASNEAETATISEDKTQLELNTLANSRVNKSQVSKYIRYSLKDKALIKEVWVNNKLTSEQPDEVVVLLKNIASVEFSSLDQAAAATTNSWPAYFQIALEHEDLGIIKKSVYFGVKQPEKDFTSLSNTQ